MNPLVNSGQISTPVHAIHGGTLSLLQSKCTFCAVRQDLSMDYRPLFHACKWVSRAGEAGWGNARILSSVWGKHHGIS
ncbi:hypothetical protein EMCG_02544 [[Emmonsia] crescens]|uniref:Uncharacterized protein n=1 Tax=[Emmonsia] crescens TaxID=73230 RepID=A0A0G2HZ45_9EURO|nr:hypothetical protein EMCG_02544 [Emmonsia crescens UAMH 3008]